ncbi:unnamed protein product [Rotaria sp. Silwood2]|nr:unnamed protein product [Rotaria sp. Silwood2]CAF4083610.1 unnamed protein product [Rotaria sp. Silwood2]
MKMHEPLSINMFTTSVDAGKSTTGINGLFAFSQSLIDCLLRLKPNEKDKKELISYCENEYKGNRVELDNLREFENSYTSDMALWWYTRESFFYKTLNAALRKQNIHMIFLYRSFIADIYRQLQHYQLQRSIRVYRSQLMSIDELDYLKQNIGQFVSVNSFLSTSKQRLIADFYIGDKTQQINLQRVLFVIDANPKVISAKPFADISTFSHFADESEVLFMLGSIFHLNSAYQDGDKVWIIGMSLCGDDEHNLKEVLTDMKKQNGTGETSLRALGKLLWTMGKLDLAEQYYNRLLEEISPNDPSLRKRAYEGYTVKVCDFGLTRTRNETTRQSKSDSTLTCTLPWAAPEILRLECHTDKSDIYSLGVVFWELATYEIPYYEYPDDVIRASVLAGDRLKIPDSTPSVFRELIKKCWAQNPNDRPNSSDLVEIIEKLIQVRGNSVLFLLYFDEP